jgi:serine/threonine-protein kinase
MKDAAPMVTTDLGACEWFVWDLRRSNLIDRGQLDQVVGEFLEKHPGAEPPALADYLVNQGILTQYQAERLLQGKIQGFVLGPFTLMDALGTGSMGTVYKARSKNDNEWYAVKVLPRRSMWNVRIARRKVRAFEQCQHPAVVPFVDVGTSGGMHYLAWALVEGETMDKRVAREGTLSAGAAAGYVLQAAEGLALCHEQGLFHGILKPSNLMIDADDQVRILDFGIGSLLAETEGESLVDTMSTANSVASGLDCASPESIMEPNNLTPLGDQYSLGCVLYFCLTGRLPFPDGTTAEKMMAHQFKQPVRVRELVPEVPEQLAAVVERLMQKTPAERYPATRELVEALRPFSTIKSRAAAAPARADSRHPAAPARPQPTEGVSRPAQADEVLSAPRFGPQAPAPAAPRPEGVATRPPARPAAAATKSSKDHPATPRPTLREPEAKPKSTPTRADFSTPAPSLEERLGPLGITIGAVLLSALAWFITWKFF